MTEAPADPIAAELTSRLVAIEGVRWVFPQRPPAAAILTLVGATGPARAVQVDADGPTLRVSARLATSRTVASRTVIGEALSAVRHVMGSRTCRIDIELAYID